MLKGRLVRLAAPLDADFAAMALWYGDGEFLRQLDAEPAAPRTEAELRQRWTEKAATGHDYYFTLRTLDGDRLVGYVGLSGIVWNHGVAWLEMAIAPGEQGRGHGGDGLAALLAFAFAELNLRRVQLTVFADNARAIALYEKTGFQREGAFREFLLRDGHKQDMLLYGLLRREWTR